MLHDRPEAAVMAAAAAAAAATSVYSVYFCIGIRCDRATLQ